ncbi:MAG: trigger factor [Nitrospira sp.]|nr:trigger factor [Nitrospira sp.]
MKLEVTELGPVKRALKIEVPEDVVNQEFDRVYTDLKRQVRVPGFRPGKAPVAMLEKRYAKAAEQDVIQRLVPTYYQKAIQESGVAPVLVEIPPLERMKANRNASLTFTATVEIKPSIELRDYRPPNPISLKPDSRTITDQDVDKALDRFREQQSRLDAAAAGTRLEEGLYAVVTIEGFLDGAPVDGSKKEGHLHKVGSQEPMLGLTIDEVLVGKQEGDQAEIPQEYPATHPDARLAGKIVTFRVSILGVKQKTLPVLDDEFAKDCGAFDTLDALKDKIRSELESVLKRDIEEGYKDQILERLLALHHFDLPEALVEREVRTLVRQRLMEEQRKKGGQFSMDDQIHMEEEAKRIQNEVAPGAQKRVKLGLVLEAIADKEGVFVSEQEIQDEFSKLAKGLQVPLEDIQKMVESGGQNSRQEFEDRIRADKALQLVYQFAVIQG